MSKPNQFKETEKLYNYYNSYEHRVERVNDILKECNLIKDIDKFYKTFNASMEDLRMELNAKKYKNTMWYCHD
jgi:hypothetical protein